MLLDITRAQKTTVIAPIKRASRSTDLTLYEVCELLSDDKKSTGVFKMARKSLEADLPFVSYCDHSHRTVDDAKACTFFALNDVETPDIYDTAHEEVEKTKSVCGG